MAKQDEYVFEIDIETRILGENEDMYVVRPGASFSLYDDFIRESAIFLGSGPNNWIPTVIRL
ncbi:hypothetical protein ACFQGS_04555 [Novosphingobium lubricantis]